MSTISKADRLRELNEYHQIAEEFRADGYLNMLNKVGTKQDNGTAWDFVSGGYVPDQKLTDLYVENGLFAKIIDRPAEDAIAKGLDLSDFGGDIAKEIQKRLLGIDFSACIATAEAWSRLYGGALIVMLINDGGGLEEPVRWEEVRSIEELIPFERPLVQPDFYAYPYGGSQCLHRRYRDPEYYDVYSERGSFRVHCSRCLTFRNGRIPEWSRLSIYRGWGIPAYLRIARALRETITSHEDGTKLLDRSVLGVYKMKNLSQLLSTDEGEDKVIQRLQVIDMARNIINSMAIDNDGEDYSYINASMAGAADIIDRTCNMLSAVTDIPQTILFGKDPSGMDSTGDNDRDNYFQLLNRIQTNSYKGAAETVVKLILKQMIAKGSISADQIPSFDIRFNSSRQLSDEEQAKVEETKAATEQTKAQTAQIYVDMQALDPSEVRKGLADASSYSIQDLVDDDSLEIPDETFDLHERQEKRRKISGGEKKTEGDNLPIANKDQSDMMEMDGSGNPYHGKDGRFTTANGTGGAPGSYRAVANSEAQAKWDLQKAPHVKVTNQKAFSKALDDNKQEIDPKIRWRVDSQPVDSLRENHPNAALYVSNKGSTMAVDGGDIIGVSASMKGKPDETGRAMMKSAVEHGGIMLDSYSGNHGFYTKCGFEPVSWCRFDKKYAPPGWDPKVDKQEPVIFYRYTGKCTAERDANKFLSAVAPSASYDEAMKARNSLMEV